MSWFVLHWAPRHKRGLVPSWLGLGLRASQRRSMFGQLSQCMRAAKLSSCVRTPTSGQCAASTPPSSQRSSYKNCQPMQPTSSPLEHAVRADWPLQWAERLAGCHYCKHVSSNGSSSSTTYVSVTVQECSADSSYTTVSVSQ